MQEAHFGPVAHLGPIVYLGPILSASLQTLRMNVNVYGMRLVPLPVIY